MSISGIAKKLPEYAINIKQNLLSIFVNLKISLSSPQLYGVALTCGYLLKHEQLLNAIRAEAKMHLEEVDARACKIAAIMMSMNNTYYRFTGYADDSELLNLGSELYMNTLDTPEIPKVDFELYCLAASILNGCKYCIKVHNNKLLQKNVTRVTLRDVGRIVAVLKATSDALEIESMRSYDFIVRGANFD